MAIRPYLTGSARALRFLARRVLLYNERIACLLMGARSMGQESLNQLLHQGIAAARGGQRDTARSILQNVVRMDPRNEIGWMWLSSVASDDSERLFCLKKLLKSTRRTNLL